MKYCVHCEKEGKYKFCRLCGRELVEKGSIKHPGSQVTVMSESVETSSETMVLCWKTTKYHIALLISLFSF